MLRLLSFVTLTIRELQGLEIPSFLGICLAPNGE